MGFYLIEGNYTNTAAEAVVTAATDRTEQVRSLVESTGGVLHHFFFCFGESDYLFLAEFGEDLSAMAVCLALNASGGSSKTKTTKLLTATEAQSAMVKAQSAKYTPPRSTIVP